MQNNADKPNFSALFQSLKFREKSPFLSPYSEDFLLSTGFGGTPAFPIISAAIRNLKALNKTFLIHTLDAWREGNAGAPPKKEIYVY